MERLTIRGFCYDTDFVTSHLQNWPIAQALKKLQSIEDAEEDRALGRTNYDRITASPKAMAAFLASLTCLEAPWDDAFHREFCDKCAAADCPPVCPHEAERNNPAWWLGQIHTRSGPVKIESRGPYQRQVANLRLEAMHQRIHFGRDILAKELEDAATTIEDLAKILKEYADGKQSL